MIDLDHSNFNNQIFTELPDLIQASNFTNCTFKVASRFERCNLNNCTVEVACYFDRSNVTDCTGEGLDSSTFDKSNNISSKEEEDRMKNRE